MPQRPKKAIERRTGTGLTESALSWFWWGGTIPNAWGQGKTPEEIRAFWRKHRREILTLFIEKNRLRGGHPGHRPEQFWEELEAQEPRRKTGREKWIGPVRIGGGIRTIVDDVFETDFEYLKRLDLLEKWELAGEILKGTEKSKIRKE